MRLYKPLLIILGTLSLSIGIVGIVVPGLPTTPFLLLTAGLYIKSSDRLYNKLISNRLVGPYIIKYNKNKGMSLKLKFYSITLMSIIITISCVCFIDSSLLKLIILALGLIGAIVMMFIVPTVNQKSDT